MQMRSRFIFFKVSFVYAAHWHRATRRLVLIVIHQCTEYAASNFTIQDLHFAHIQLVNEDGRVSDLSNGASPNPQFEPINGGCPWQYAPACGFGG